MICIICEKKTKDKTKNIPCCRDCRQKITAKRDEMKTEMKAVASQLSVEGLGKEERQKIWNKFIKMPIGNIKNAILALEREKFRVLRDDNEKIKGELND